MKYTQYPNYQAGQFLSSDDLNGSFNYLEEQIRLSRTVQGYGIISGFSYSLRDSLRIDPGIALTRDGHVIVLQEPVELDVRELYKKYKQPLRSNPLLLIRRKTYETDTQTCDVVSCDVHKSNIKVEFSFELEPDQGDASYLRFPMPDASKVRPIRTRRPVNPLRLCDLQVMNEVVRDTFVYNKNLLLEEMERLISVPNSRDYDYYRFGTSDYLSGQLGRAMSSVKSLGYKMTEIPQHFLFHLENLKKAIMEYKIAHYDFVCKYRAMEKEHPDGCIFLGLVNNFDPESLQRSVFVRNADTAEAYRNEKSRKNKLLHRIIRIAFNIQTLGSNTGSVKFIPTRKDGLLEDEVMPSYYKTYALDDLWEIDQNVRTFARTRYQWNSFRQEYYLENLDEFRYFSLEGNYYKDYKTIYNTLSHLISRYNLPFNIKTVELRKPSIRRSYDAVYQRVKDLKLEEINQLQNSVMPSFKKMITRMRSGDDAISHLICGVNPYCKELLEIDISENAIKALPFEISGNMKVIYDLKEMAKVVSFLPQDAELSSCAERGKTFVLLYFNSKVVATLSCSAF